MKYYVYVFVDPYGFIRAVSHTSGDVANSINHYLVSSPIRDILINYDVQIIEMASASIAEDFAQLIKSELALKDGYIRKDKRWKKNWFISDWMTIDEYQNYEIKRKYGIDDLEASGEFAAIFISLLVIVKKIYRYIRKEDCLTPYYIWDSEEMYNEIFYRCIDISSQTRTLSNSEFSRLKSFFSGRDIRFTRKIFEGKPNDKLLIDTNLVEMGAHPSIILAMVIFDTLEFICNFVRKGDARRFEDILFDSYNQYYKEITNDYTKGLQ